MITVGRDPEADVFLDNPSISREHVRLERMPNGHFCMKDPGSANGTFLNEERVQGAMIYNGDVIRIGKFSLWIALERDRRGQASDAGARAAADSSQSTMMLTPEEINRLMTINRKREIVPPDMPAAAAQVPRKPVTAPAEATKSRVVTLLGIGAALVLATSLGVAVAWLFLK